MEIRKIQQSENGDGWRKLDRKGKETSKQR
jgi:hypothetical protein